MQLKRLFTYWLFCNYPALTPGPSLSGWERGVLLPSPTVGEGLGMGAFSYVFLL